MMLAASDPPGYSRMSWRSAPTSGNCTVISVAIRGSTLRAR
ncbi:Uncharacterised protein [Mycobacteroides abscessus subsp. abscessus]|nr:Uncharacterised protein [Mycobacteroides abscessus subsp. abscessus]